MRRSRRLAPPPRATPCQCRIASSISKVTVRKTYPLRPEGKHPDRVLDAVKHDIRKYMKRERRDPLPEGADFWDFDCRFGADKDSAEGMHWPSRALRPVMWNCWPSLATASAALPGPLPRLGLLARMPHDHRLAGCH